MIKQKDIGGNSKDLKLDSVVVSRIPIIILNWNGLEDTKECMTSVLAMEGQAYEVILVDNGSSAEEQKELKKLYGNHSDISLVLNDENKGFTRGNSDIVDEIMARDEVPSYVALLNNDTVVSVRWLAELVAGAKEHEIEAVSSKMINYFDRSKIDNIGHFLLNTGEILPLGHGKNSKGFQANIQNIGACGGAVLYDTSMIKSIGFFDPFFNTGYEDAEYGLRAKLLGYKCQYVPQAVVYHKVSQSIKKIMDDRYLQRVQINIFYTLIKLMPRRFLYLNLPIVIVKYIIWFFTGLIAMQFALIRLHLKTAWQFVTIHLKRARKSRQEFMENFTIDERYRNSLIEPSEFFLKADTRRMIRRLKNAS